MQLFDYWIVKHSIDLTNAMELKCFRSKVWEMVWVRESKQWDLGKAKFEFNLNSLHGHDVWYVASPFSWLPTEVKRQTTTFACKANDFGIDAHNFLCIRTKQLQRYCMEGLELIVYDRDIDMTRPANARVTKFMRINGVDDGRELISNRKLVYVEVKRLCDMYMRKQGIINLRIPYDKRHQSEQFDGHTCAFAATEFPSVPIT